MKKYYLLFLSLLAFSLYAQKPGYYNGAEGKSGNELKAILHEVINNHVNFSYSDAKYILEYAQEDPVNSSNLITFYTNVSVAKNKSSWGSGGDFLNREHVWAQSHGGLSGNRPMDGDAYNLHAADASVNMTRSNYDFDNVEGGTYIAEADAYYGGGAYEPADHDKGEVARTLMYMAVRYEGTNGEMDLELEDKIGTAPGATHGKLSTLLHWNRDFPPSNFERRRNDRVAQCQGNRNPFIDNPVWADLIWAEETISDVKIGNMSINPEFPKKTDNVVFNAGILTNLGAIPSATLYYGKSFNQDTYSVEMSGQSEVSANMDVSSFNANEQVFYKIKTESLDSICGSFYLDSDDELVTISEIQGTGTESPLKNQQVAVVGIVTANFDNVFVMQSGKGARNGVAVYSIFRGQIGDSVKVKGKAVEYSGLTEISNVTSVYNYGKGAEVEAEEIIISDINEDYEGVLVELKGVTFNEGGSDFPPSDTYPYPTFTVSDGVNNITFYTRYGSRLNTMPIPNGTVNLKAIVSEYNGNYQIMSNDTSWFTPAIDNTAPSVVSIALEYVSETKIWMYVNFNEIITETSVEEEDNFVLSDDIIIARNYYNEAKPNQVKIWLRSMSEGVHTLTFKNIEDVNGNVLSESSFEFTSTISTSVENTHLNSTTLYPNPSDGNIQLLSTKQMRGVDVYSVTGERIKTIHFSARKEIKLELNGLAEGSYVLLIKHTDNTNEKLRLIIN